MPKLELHSHELFARSYLHSDNAAYAYRDHFDPFTHDRRMLAAAIAIGQIASDHRWGFNCAVGEGSIRVVLRQSTGTEYSRINNL